MDLVKRIAELQFLNRDYVLMFRGQADDYRNSKGSSTLKPEIMRASDPKKVPTAGTVEKRFSALEATERELVRQYAKEKWSGIQRLRRQQILRWSILQHYKVCETPLLDVTHSLRIAASFAALGGGGGGYVFVVGIPNVSGAITASAEAGLQIVRLASVCPPAALRPHIQEGYLLGEYPVLSSVKQQNQYKHYEIDFGRRLIAKFKIGSAGFWNADLFPKVEEAALYPSADDDRLRRLAETVKAQATS
jgi:hypothetical protein